MTAEPEPIHRSDVFGLRRDLPLNYVSRNGVDGVLVEELTRDKHIVIFGSSKQGKTCLRKQNLPADDYITVTCSNRWTLKDLHAAILKEAGFTVEQSSSRTVAGDPKIRASFGGKLGIPGVGELSGKLGSERGGGTETTVREPLELDATDVNDVIRALSSAQFKKWIVLEDFHYLPIDTQRDFAVALKAFHENSGFCFIVVGVWLDENRLIQYNGDLTGRVVPIAADAWTPEELREIIEKGERLLQIRFDEKFKTEVIAGSFESVYIVQEACNRACELSGIHFRQSAGPTRVIGGQLDAGAIIRERVDQQSPRYHSFIENFAAGFTTSDLEMYKWILFAILTADAARLEAGLRLREVIEAVSAKHPRGRSLNPGNLTQALQSSASLQTQLNIKPIVLDYDQSTRRLNVVDRGFLVWLQHQDRAELLRSIGLPTD